MNVRELSSYVDDRPEEGVFRIHPDAFADPALFDLEQKHIFERTWAFLGFESQLSHPHDFVSTHIGRVPVIVTRDANGRIGAFLNFCRHKGAVLCRTETGNRKYLVCSYHGWSYDSGGKMVYVKDRKSGCYSASFDAEDHNLVAIGRVGLYKGLVFGSLNPDVPPIEEYLGELKFFVDLAMEQGPRGMECLPGRVAYTFDANWKLQMDNGVDLYHLTSTHKSLMEVVRRRDEQNKGNLEARQFDWKKRLTQQGGTFAFKYGHNLIWLNQAQPEKRPVHATIDEVRGRLGDRKADWMLKLRNMTIFPNLQIADSTALILRTFRPLAVNRTEMRLYCLAPIGEPAQVRSWRLRQFEDFFNVSGMATPDDTTLYEDVQAGFAVRPQPWLQGYQRGMTALTRGANDVARELGVEPQASVKAMFDVQDETAFQPPYREWARLIQAGISGQSAYGN